MVRTGVNLARRRIERERDRAFETVVLGQQSGQRGKRLFGTVLLIAGEKHKVLPFARSRGAFVNQRLGPGVRGDCREEQKQGDTFHIVHLRIN